MMRRHWTVGLILALASPVLSLAQAGVPQEDPLAERDRQRLALLAESGLERRTLDTDSGTLVYWLGGEGQPLVLLHGSGDSAGGWAAVVSQIAGDYRLLVPDLAGHGDSEPAEGVLPLAVIVNGLEALLAEVALDKPVLAGNSMGAWLAMLYAHKHPERVDRVVAINGGAILAEPSEITLMPKDREQARTVMAALRDPSSPPLPDEVLDAIVLRSGSGPIARMMMDLPGMMGYLLDGRLSEISTPVEMLWGESDGLMKVSYAEKMAAALPRSRITLIPKCGHIPISECPDRFVELLRATLAKEPPVVEPDQPEEEGVSQDVDPEKIQ
jgi:pimeloyl-ACP methyl ester carboxylesterase